MIETKHTFITEQLKQRIVDGHYGEKLPPLRILMQEFNVSMQTINKAVKPLSAAGFITAGPRGSVINYFSNKRPKYYAVGLLCQRIADNDEPPEILTRLTGHLKYYEDYNAMLLTLSNERLKRDPHFWETCPVDVLIFGYRTLTPELAWPVYRSGIIPLARHHADGLPVHVCEYDTFGAIDSAVGQLKAGGYRRIALQFFRPLSGYDRFAARRWSAIREKHGIDLPGYETPVYFEDCPLDFTKPLPEAILCWHTAYDQMLEIIGKAGLGRQVKVVSYTQEARGYGNFIGIAPPSDELYWHMAGELLKEIMNAPPLKFLHCMVPFEAKFPHGIPTKK